MVLDSQTPRAGYARAHMASRRRGLPLRIPAVVLVLAVVAAVSWYMIRHSGGQPSDANTPPPQQQQAGIGGGDRGQDRAGEDDTDARHAAMDTMVMRSNPQADDAERSQPNPRVERSGSTDGTDRTATGNTRSGPDANDPAMARGQGDATGSDATGPDGAAGRTDTAATGNRPTQNGNTASGNGEDGGDGQAARTAPNISPGTPAATAERIRQGRARIAERDLVAGRRLLNAALTGPISQRDAREVRKELASVNEVLVFSPRVTADDPLCAAHVVQSGEYLSTISRPYDVPWQFIAHVNRIEDPRRVRAGARLKVVNGPFHVVVDKSDYRADAYLVGPDGPVFIRSFKVGLGEHGSTPAGQFVVRKHSKLENPEWTNPRTGKRYLADDPTNPVGEHWVGLRGIDDQTEQMKGYGLHGTIEPDSIGTEASMGCVRFMPDDIALLFTMLSEEKSTITIVP